MNSQAHKQLARALVRPTSAVLLAIAPVNVLAGPVEHEEDTLIGRTSNGQLGVVVNSPGLNELFPVSGLLRGWAGDEPGFTATDAFVPTEDLFPLGAGALVRLELVSIDPALKVWSPGFTALLDAPGESFLLGGAAFDTHATFHVDSSDPAFESGAIAYSATFRAFDAGETGYSASDPFTLQFTPVPEPATALTLAASAWCVWATCRRRRRAASEGAMTVGCVGFSLLASALASTAALGQHDTDIWIGVSGGKLALSPAGLTPGTVYHPVSPVDSFIVGWTANDPGFDHVTVSQGAVSPLPVGAQVWLSVVSLDAALFVIDNGLDVLERAGDRTPLGGSALHEHLTWFVDQTDPLFDPEQCVWEGTFKLVDRGNLFLGESKPFTLLFSTVPVRGGEFPPTPSAATGDFDGNRAVELFDHSAFTVCFDGPERRPAPDDPEITACEVDCFNVFDTDDDLDSDLGDFAAFQREFGH